MKPSVGRTVAYTMTADDAHSINKRRADARSSHIAQDQSGAVVHFGNEVSAGDVYPMVIVRIWGSEENSAVNGQVMLDGNDAFWAIRRTQGDNHGQWHEFSRV